MSEVTVSAAEREMIGALVEVSRFFGADPEIVLAGGGNTSVKTESTLWVKGSGTALATIDASGFVVMDREKLRGIVAADYGSEPEKREAAYKEALLASRLEPERGQRPSVEALLHHLIPFRYVVHSHATVVNTVTCSSGGEKLARELLGERVMWLPYVDPGYTLAKELDRLLKVYVGKWGEGPRVILMANHGLIVSGDTTEEIKALTAEVVGKIGGRLGEGWATSFGGAASGDVVEAVNVIGPALRGLLAESDEALKIVTFDDSEVVRAFVGSGGGKEAEAATLAGPLNPDQIVYCNSYPAWFEWVGGESAGETVARLRGVLEGQKARTGFAAQVVLVKGVGLFAVADDWKGADTTRSLYVDSIKVMAGARRLGGGLGGISHLTEVQRKFIESWEVEAYRKQVAKMAGGTGGRVKNKVAVVTGAAQGFGLEIAQGFAGAGGYVALTDMNEGGAVAAAGGIEAERGRGRAMGVKINVTDGSSVAGALHAVVRMYGGVDVLVSNAGVLKAGSVKTLSEKDFDFVTTVNYKGYFVCVQQVAGVMGVQHLARPGYMADVVQINSKSGLQGSNKNGAYAGSKFGGIGLTQSFAMELIEDGIKVNSICPGNFFDGPLWSEPANGLFAQYLRTGKVPGAKTIEDVKKFYEAKVPMGRGCTTADVMKAIFYLMDQKYETGQALPVSGGQVMLK